MKTNFKLYLFAAICAVVSLGLIGCQSGGNYQKAEKTSADLTAAANNIEAAKGKVDTAVSALNNMSAGQTNLVEQFTTYRTAVSALESSAKDVSGKVSAMRAKGNDYFKAWDLQIAQIKNEDIKNRSLARKNEMEQRFTKIKMSYQKVSDSYQPVMQEFKDIQVALSTDLTTAGVASVKTAIEKVGKDAEPLKSSLDELATQFKELGAAMGTGPAPTPPAEPAK